MNFRSRNIKTKDYQGKIILQEFIEPIEDRDYRVWVLDGKVVFYCYPIKGRLGVPLPKGWDENNSRLKIHLSNLFIW